MVVAAPFTAIIPAPPASFHPSIITVTATSDTDCRRHCDDCP
ncbi:hypothetical protein HanRHA438_Chr13g0587291 [Helianthus annuus]|nr:hypothetical protein HanRHA438_Chr13g0587291 [Helianthus annuus]